MMFEVRIIQGSNERLLFAEEGARLSDVLTANGISAEHPCGCLGLCRKCRAIVNGRSALTCRHIISEDITCILPESAVSLVSDGELTDGNFFIALDIGTTTLVAALCNDSKRVLRTVTELNPQRLFGADVMSRISYCTSHGPEPLQKILIDRMHEMIRVLVPEGHTVPEMIVSGNTAMLHLFLGIDCSAMGTAPYTPAFLDGRELSGAKIGLPEVDVIHTLPCMASFAGADITAGICSVGQPEEGKYNLLVDLGTNAETALWNGRKILCTSAAAGPCFEGGNISCGMRAGKGALSKVKEDGSVCVIGGVAAEGLCATGLIDAIAVLRNRNIIDFSGYMGCSVFDLCPGVTLTQSDVRAFQEAKAAVCSAIKILMLRAGIDADDIGGFYVAGGFSEEMNIASAARIGLFPKKLEKKFIPVNNSALTGTIRCRGKIYEAEEIAEKAQYIDLSADVDFFDSYIDCMELEPV